MLFKSFASNDTFNKPLETPFKPGGGVCEFHVDFTAAVRSGNVCQVQSILALGLNPDFILFSGRPLHEATRLDGPEGIRIVDLLIDAGAKVNCTGVSGWTPLHWACQKDRVDMARHLILRGADVRQVNDDLYSPIHRAMQMDSLKCLELFLDLGADPDAMDINGESLKVNTKFPEMTSFYFSWLARSSAKKALQEIMQ